MRSRASSFVFVVMLLTLVVATGCAKREEVAAPQQSDAKQSNTK